MKWVPALAIELSTLALNLHEKTARVCVNEYTFVHWMNEWKKHSNLHVAWNVYEYKIILNIYYVLKHVCMLIQFRIILQLV